MTATTLDTIVADANAVVNALSPYLPALTALVPGAGAGISIGVKIIQGALALEPKAQALVQQVMAGTPLTADQVNAYISTYDADDDQLNADLAALIVKLSPKT